MLRNDEIRARGGSAAPTEAASRRGCDPHLRACLAQGFENSPTVGFHAAAKLLKMNEKTLRKAVRSGRIPFRETGGGPLRKRREFALADLEDFYSGAERRYPETAGSSWQAGPAPSSPRKAAAPARGSFLAERAKRLASRERR